MPVDSPCLDVSLTVRQNVLLKRRPQHRSDTPSFCIVLDDLKDRRVLDACQSLDVLDPHFVLGVQENDVDPLTYTVLVEVLIAS